MSRSRRRTRLRSTAVPTLRDTVNPIRAGPPSSRLRPCSTKAAVATLAPLAAARKSARCFSRTIMRGFRGSGAKPLAAAIAPGGDHLAAARGRHAGAKSVTALAHNFAGLIGPLHGCFSAWIRVLPKIAPERGQTRLRARKKPSVGIAGTFQVPRLIREAALARQWNRVLAQVGELPAQSAQITVRWRRYRTPSCIEVDGPRLP